MKILKVHEAGCRCVDPFYHAEVRWPESGRGGTPAPFRSGQASAAPAFEASFYGSDWLAHSDQLGPGGGKSSPLLSWVYGGFIYRAILTIWGRPRQAPGPTQLLSLEIPTGV